jgi:2-octaprenylphenol hydroxylase
VRPEKHHGDIARQRFMPTGPLAFLPINDGSCSIVWSTLPAHADLLMKLDEPGFCRELEIASQNVLGGIAQVGPRGVFPLALRHADRYVSEGLALIGDAAHGIHPLAGQGVNLGLLDAAVLYDVLLDAGLRGRPLGGWATLRRYERARKGNNLEMLALMDLFKRVFSNDNRPLTLLRNLGLNLADASGPLKRALVRRAMGLTGELPSLAGRHPWSASAGAVASSSSHYYPRR